MVYLCESHLLHRAYDGLLRNALVNRIPEIIYECAGITIKSAYHRDHRRHELQVQPKYMIEKWRRRGRYFQE